MVSPKTNTPDFFNLLVQHMRRIDENFTIGWTDETPLQQALNCLINAIEIIEDYKQQDPVFANQDSQEVYEASEKLQQYENLLKNKEEKLKADEVALYKEKQLLTNEKEKVKRLKEHCVELEHELKSQKEALDRREKEENARYHMRNDKIERESSALEEEKSRIDREAHEIEIIKNKLEELNSSLISEREELEQDRSLVFEKSLELEKEKWRLEGEKNSIEEKIAINTHLFEKISHELSNIEYERANLLKSKIEHHADNYKQSEGYKSVEQEKLYLKELQNSTLSEKLLLAEEREKLTVEEERISQIVGELEAERQKLEEDRRRFEKEKIIMIEEQQAVDEAWDEIEEKQGSQTGARRGRPEEDYTQMLEELQAQMICYNKEVEIREREIDIKNSALLQKEEELDNKLAEIQAVELSLLRAKHELEELSLGTIPELENQSLNIHKILADLLVKRSEVDSGYNILQARIDEFERNKSGGRSSKGIERLADELEGKVRKIKEREDELTLLETMLEKEKKENLRHAMFLQNAEKEFEIKCQKKEAEILDAKRRLEKLQTKLESAIMLMNTKENELINMKESILDERNKMISPDFASNRNEANDE